MDALERMLNNAEMCYERGQIRMATAALVHIDETYDEEDFNDAQLERYNLLCDFLDQDQPNQRVAHAADIEGKCIRCNGTGKYKERRICYACKGKGVQDATDVVRNKNYWAVRQQQIQARKTTAEAAQSSF